jgi:homeobox-leucine zipper protein
MDFGDDVMDGAGSDAQRRKKRYHRHTPRQIQQLEAYVHPGRPARAEIFPPFLPYLSIGYLCLFVLDALLKWRRRLSVPVRARRMFKECPHPDENQRMHLSRELGLEPRQIKFWFQNRRTQMKV